MGGIFKAAAVEPLECRRLLAGTLLGDFNTAAAESVPADFTNVNGTMFFTAQRQNIGYELWRSDGTVQGTTLLKTFPTTRPSSLVNFNGSLFFAASDEASGTELWKSDGTAAGTVMVQDLRAGAGNSEPQQLTVSNGKLIFTARSTSTIWEIWSSDGRVGGCTLLKTLSSSTAPFDFTDVNGMLFFSDGSLWKTDGTTPGTAIVKDLTGTTADNVQALVRAGSRIFFVADPGNGTGREVYSSDGTAAGTAIVKDIQLGSGGGAAQLGKTGMLGGADGILYFGANDTGSSSNIDLWRSDGTTDGTFKLQELNTSGGISNWVWYNNRAHFTKSFDGMWQTDGTVLGTQKAFDTPHSATYFSQVGSYIYFSGYDATREWEIFRSDGTTAGTYPITDFSVSGSGSFISGYGWAGSNLFLSGPQPGFDIAKGLSRELWGVDLTMAASGSSAQHFLKDIETGTKNSSATLLGKIGQISFLAVDEGTSGVQLYKSDGTPAGTGLVKRIAPGTNSADPANFIVVNGVGYFAASSSTGRELWRTDGTDAGTYLVKDINPSSAGTGLSSTLVDANGTLYFRADNGVNGFELWKSDGTAGGTVMVKDINVGASSSSITSLLAVGSTVYFAATNGSSGSELWKSDGTGVGTLMVKDIFSGGSSSSPADLFAVGSSVYFTATASSGNRELWKSDGTSAGTTLVREINASGAAFTSSSFKPLLLGGVLLFGADNGTNGVELWRSDGTSGGTFLVRDVVSGAGGSSPQMMTTLNGRALFTITNGASQELWASNGTSGGTVKLASLPAFIDTLRSSDSWEVIGNTMYFAGASAAGGAELWKTDGTPSGTTLVADIVPGSAGSNPAYLVASDGILYFAATASSGQRELWQSDGTAGGTLQVTDIWTDDAASPAILSTTSPYILFSAASPTVGRELFAFDDFVIQSGTLSVRGTSANDQITLSGSGANRVLDRNGAVTKIPAETVSSIRILGGSGNDSVHFDGSGTFVFDNDAGLDSENIDITATDNVELTVKATQHLGSLHLLGNSSARVVANGTHTLYLNTLDASADARLDLNDNDLVINNGNFSNIQSLVWQGYRDYSDPAATGIISTTAQTTPGHPILALFDNAKLRTTDWPWGSGNTVGASAILGQYALLGDADLNGMVTPDDYGAIDSNLGNHVGTLEATGGMSWFAGDWNFDGEITPDDYLTVDSNLGLRTDDPQPVSQLVANGFPAARPEPLFAMVPIGTLPLVGADVTADRDALDPLK
jgi:ELWxxDGT repeat protein